MKLWAILRVVSGVLAFVFAFAAAFFWCWSTKIHVPVLDSCYGTLCTVMEDGSKVNGVAPFYAALANISRLNAVAAVCAGVSAITQVVTLLRK
jgi:hypothetical protein